MVKEKVEFDYSKIGDIQKDVIHFERLIGDLIGILSKSISFCVHSSESVNELLNRLTRNCEGMNDKNGDDSNIIIQESSYIHEYDANMNNNDNRIDYIRFTNSGPLYSLPKRITNSLVGTYLYENSKEDQRTVDGTIFIDYRGDETLFPLLIDSLMNKKINIDKLSLCDQIDLLNLFEYCELPIPEELVKTYYRRDYGVKLYKEDDDVILYVNDKKDDILRDYWKENGLWNDYLYEYGHGYVDYEEIDNLMSIKMNYKYIDYIHEFIKYHINKISEIPLINWLGTEKKWTLLFRASEHNYSASEFHKYCDNQGETVTLIKHIGKNNKINIFGGYTDQSWESDSGDKLVSKEFLFTLRNEHGIPPTQYKHNGNGRGIYCVCSHGPSFGGGPDIDILDNCQKSSNNAWNNSRSFTTINTTQKASLFVNTASSNSTNFFQIENYEVWGRI
ncbi:hypothetical protein WA158_006422 [Blastocystis sp. Blastoise]